MPRGQSNEVIDSRTCADGVNEQVAAATKNQCIDARNVWERGGRLVQRPGSTVTDALSAQYVPAFVHPAGANNTIDGGRSVYRLWAEHVQQMIVRVENPAGVFTGPASGDVPVGGALTGNVDIDNLPVGANIFVGYTIPVTAFGLYVFSPNTAASGATFSYWNGSAWVATVPLLWNPGRYIDGGGSQIDAYEAASAATQLFNKPSWATVSPPMRFFIVSTKVQSSAQATTTVNGVSAYWWKITITGNALNSGGAGMLLYTWLTPTWTTSQWASAVFRSAQALDWVGGTPIVAPAIFPLSQRVLLAAPLRDGLGTVFCSTESLELGARWMQWTAPWLSQPIGSAAVDAQGGRVYIALSGHVTKHRALPAPEDDIIANVETADWAVGPGAPYDKNSVAQLPAFPAASLIAWFQNRLWFGAIEGEPNAIRWSAAGAYHEVIPALAVEYIDQPPTAMKPLGENMVVYTQDNIYLGVLDSVDDFSVPHFKFIKVVAGRGCVAQNSVVEINGRHIFLSEDGLYAFDGTSNIVKITLARSFTQLGASMSSDIDRLATTFSRVNKSARQAASAVHWRSQRVMLVSLPIDGSATNNLTVVWDYERDKFWLWDGLAAQAWINVNTNVTDEELYFITAGGSIYKFNENLPSDDTVPITTYIVTSPIGLRDSMHKGMTETKVLASNQTGQLVVESWPNGIQSQAKTGTLKFLDYNESLVGSLVIGTGKVAAQNIRFRHTHFKTDGSYFHVKVSGPNALGKKFDMVNLDTRYVYKYEDTR